MHGNWLLLIPYALVILSFVLVIRAQRGTAYPKRFSLRALLIALTLASLLLGLIAWSRL